VLGLVVLIYRVCSRYVVVMERPELSDIYLAAGCVVQTIYSTVIKFGIVGLAKKLATNSIGRSKCYL
jgi:hypothetical protein